MMELSDRDIYMRVMKKQRENLPSEEQIRAHQRKNTHEWRFMTEIGLQLGRVPLHHERALDEGYKPKPKEKECEYCLSVYTITDSNENEPCPGCGSRRFKEKS